MLAAGIPGQKRQTPFVGVIAKTWKGYYLTPKGSYLNFVANP